MSKKRKAEAPAADLVEARVMREREWAHAGWLAHKSFRQLRIEAARPVEEGGLGYTLGLHAIKGLVEQARAEAGELRLDREAHIERELNDLDLVQQLAAASMKRAAEAHALDVHASKLYVETGAQRRKLLGLDTPVKIEAEVTHRDAVTEELNAMLARLGEPMIEEAPKL